LAVLKTKIEEEHMGHVSLGRRLFELAIVALLMVIGVHAIAAEVVRTEGGALRGVAGDGIEKYLGIPYAAPPTGDLRWKPPQAPARWQGTRDAGAFGGTCPQTTAVGEFGAPSTTEDCLYLNVFAPTSRASSGKKLPVMFWIPGGGLFAGGSNDYDTSALVKTGNLVVVTMNYRVGVLGFFSHPDIDAEGHESADYGLLDQQMALKWVRRNISSFGGDAGNVTIFGESAGALSVYGHMASPGSKGLFHKGILHSGLTGIAKPNLVLPLADATALGKKFAVAMGCATDTAACLRRLPVQKIIDQQMPFLSGLIVGGQTVPEPLEQAFRSGRFNKVPLINGTNHDEWRWPAARVELRSGKPLAPGQYLAALTDFFGDAGAKVESEYPLSRFGSPSEALAAAETDAYFSCTAVRNDATLSKSAPVYGYEFNYSHAPMYMPSASFPYGAAHTVELQFIFPLFHGGSGTVHTLNSAESELASTMVRYWSNFARTGDPNALSLPTWPRFNPDTRLLMSLDLPRPTALASFRADHRCDFWTSVLK
jgi:para-nitrobenzyl esterase